VCLSLAAFPHHYTDLDVSWGNGRGCPLVVHYWVDLQSAHGFHCYDSIALNTKCQRVLVLSGGSRTGLLGGLQGGTEKIKHEGINRDVSANSLMLASSIRQNSSE